jgi:diketogulonate reductase-like aldo/keto reductase
MKDQYNQSRRRLLQAMSVALAGLIVPATAFTKAATLLTKPIPSSKQPIPLIGLGSSRTFNVGDDPQGLDNVAEVMRHFFMAGGTLIDSSPMYGSSQPAIGYGLRKLGKQEAVFAADKVWTSAFESGPAQMEQSRRYWNVDAFDLMQIHNLVDWQTHIETLHDMKRNGTIRYVGITTSHGRRHDELEQILRTQPLDFVQFSYNILDREVEKRLLPVAQQRGVAVIINRPFRRGDLIDELENKPLPPFAGELGCNSWPQLLLKFVVSHPAVTCAIPATSQVEHVKENMMACYGPLPDQAMRVRMINYVEKII